MNITQGIILEVFEKNLFGSLGTSKGGFCDGVKLWRAWTEREGLSHTVVRSQGSHYLLCADINCYLKYIMDVLCSQRGEVEMLRFLEQKAAGM